MSFTFSFLGACEISRHDKSVGFATNTARALLAYLAAHANQPQQRGHLAGLFYPDQTQTLALANLRSTLARVRKSIAEDDQALAVTNHTIEFRCEVERIDVLEFEAALAECATHAHRDALTCPDCAHQLQHAARLYRGDFLQGMSLANSQPFEEWLLFKREQLHRLALDTLHTLGSIHESRADFETMRHYAERQLTLEPWREEAHLQLMRALVYLGRRTDALAQYDACRVVLHDEFGIEPSPEITAVYKAVRSNTAQAKDEAHAPASISWSKVPDPQHLFGRDAEAAQLEHWLTHDRSRVVGILGIGGVGKTTLAATVTRAASSQFETVIWYSLINAPLPADALRAILQTASSYAITDMPTTLDDQLRLLLDCLQQRRCLIVLDNLESILEASWAGHFRAGYEAYGQIMTQVASYSHESSLLFTSREQPQALSRMLGATAFVRMLRVSGVDVAAGKAILNAHGIGATVEDATALVQHYSGNPLALQLVSHTISTLFGGDVAKFQREAAGVFGDIRDMLAEQFARLTDLEQSLMLWLAIEREPVSFDQLRGSLVHKYTSQTVLEALGNLKKRSLLESSDSDRPRPPTAVYALQNVVMEYVTSVWVAAAGDEVITGTLARLHTHALMKAQAKEYVRQAQMGLIVQPVAERVLAELGKSALPSHLGTILDGLRAESAQRTHELCRRQPLESGAALGCGCARHELYPPHAARGVLAREESGGRELCGYRSVGGSLWRYVQRLPQRGLQPHRICVGGIHQQRRDSAVARRWQPSTLDLEGTFETGVGAGQQPMPGPTGQRRRGWLCAAVGSLERQRRCVGQPVGVSVRRNRARGRRSSLWHLDGERGRRPNRAPVEHADRCGHRSVARPHQLGDSAGV